MSVDTSTTPVDDAPESADPEPADAPPDNVEQQAETEQQDQATRSTADGEQTNEEQAKPKRGRPKGASARKTRTVELTLTVTGTADGEWQAELKHGSKWVARGLEIPAAAVSRAAKELHAELSEPIDEVINAAREQQQERVAQLEAELEQAKQALAHLDS